MCLFAFNTPTAPKQHRFIKHVLKDSTTGRKWLELLKDVRVETGTGKQNGLNSRSKRFNHTNFHKMLKYQMTSNTQVDTLTLRKYKSTVCLSVRRDNIRTSDAAARGSVATASGGVRATSSVSAAETCKIRNSVFQ
jgi:hypothetical protein